MLGSGEYAADFDGLIASVRKDGAKVRRHAPVQGVQAHVVPGQS